MSKQDTLNDSKEFAELYTQVMELVFVELFFLFSIFKNGANEAYIGSVSLRGCFLFFCISIFFLCTHLEAHSVSCLHVLFYIVQLYMHNTNHFISLY